MSYPTAYRSAGARAKAGGLSVPVAGRMKPTSQSRAPTTSRGGYNPLRPWTPQSGVAGWRPPVAANSNSLAAARVLASLGIALRIGRSLHPLLSVALAMLEAYRFAQERWFDPPLALSYAGFVQTHVCNFPNTGGPDKRGGPGSCLSGQGSPGPLSAGAPIQGAEWNNGFSVYGLITTLPFARWNMIASYAPIWQDTGISNPDPKITLPPPAEIPPFVDPMVNAPFQTAPVPFDPPLWFVRARERMPVGDPLPEQSERGDEEPLQVGRIEIDLAPQLPGVQFLPRWRGDEVPFQPPKPGAPRARPGQRKKKEDESEQEDVDKPPFRVDFEPFIPWDEHVFDKDRAKFPRPRSGEAVITNEGTKIRPSQHRNARPKAGTKERKVVVSASRTFAGKAFGAVTEVGDALDAVYEALPEKIRKRERARRHGRDPRATSKLRILWEHWDEVDVVDAIDNLARNHLEDWFYGQLNRRAQRALNDAGWQRPFGIQAGNTLGFRPEGLQGITG